MDPYQFVAGVMHNQAEECLAALVEAIEELELSEEDTNNVFVHLAQVCDIAGLYPPEQLQDI